MSKIIAFTGKKGTGKSTCCAYLEEKYGFTRVNFKDALIAELKQYYSLVLDELAIIYDMPVDQLFEIKPPVVRKLMQSHGQMRREENPEYWVLQWKLAVVDALMNGAKGITTDDCRYLNESMAVKAWRGTVIKQERTDMEHTDTHISETEMDSIVPDYTIVCNGNDFGHLHAELDAIMTK